MITLKFFSRLPILIISSLLISSCSNIIAPGVPTLESRYTPKLAKPKPNIDFKLIPINSNVIAKLPKFKKAPRRKSFASRPAGIGGYSYRIGRQDILSITVWDHPELTIPAGEFRSAKAAGHKVGSDGRFFFPYAGKVLAAGRTTEQVRGELERKLAKFITKPQVGVAIAAYRSQQASISGHVIKPGVFALDDIPLTIKGIIAKSGGLDKNASDYALLTHHKQKIEIDLDALYRKGDSTQDYVLRGGDSLYIADKSSATKVFVMGEVKKPGSVPLGRFGLTLAEALSDSGSIDESTANPRGVFVIRQEKASDRLASVYQLRIRSVHSMLLAEQFSLRSRDIVYVTAAPVTKWNRVISQILPSLSIVSAAKNLTK